MTYRQSMHQVPQGTKRILRDLMKNQQHQDPQRLRQIYEDPTRSRETWKTVMLSETWVLKTIAGATPPVEPEGP